MIPVLSWLRNGSPFLVWYSVEPWRSDLELCCGCNARHLTSCHQGLHRRRSREWFYSLHSQRKNHLDLRLVRCQVLKKVNEIYSLLIGHFIQTRFLASPLTLNVGIVISDWLSLRIFESLLFFSTTPFATLSKCASEYSPIMALILLGSYSGWIVVVTSNPIQLKKKMCSYLPQWWREVLGEGVFLAVKNPKDTYRAYLILPNLLEGDDITPTRRRKIRAKPGAGDASRIYLSTGFVGGERIQKAITYAYHILSSKSSICVSHRFAAVFGRPLTWHCRVTFSLILNSFLGWHIYSYQNY